MFFIIKAITSVFDELSKSSTVIGEGSMRCVCLENDLNEFFCIRVNFSAMFGLSKKYVVKGGVWNSTVFVWNVYKTVSNSKDVFNFKDDSE